MALTDLLEESTLADEPRITGASKVVPGGVDPLGLRQINFDLMDEVLPGLNNVANRLKPFLLMTWAWRRARTIVQQGGQGGALDADLRDFVDRIETIYAWSQFLIDPTAGIPGGQALAALLSPSTESYTFGGAQWLSRRDLRRTSTGLISPLNYGPGLRLMGWLTLTDTPGVFGTNPRLDDALDQFEAAMAEELDHPAFSKFGEVVVDRVDVERWAPLWALGAKSTVEEEAGFDRLAGPSADPKRRRGLTLIEAAAANLDDPKAEAEDFRRLMADSPDAWSAEGELAGTAGAWRKLQIRQLFRYALEATFYWLIGELDGPPKSSSELGASFVEAAGAESLADTGEWFRFDASANPVDLIDRLSEALSGESAQSVPGAIQQALAFCLAQTDYKAEAFEVFDRLPIPRAIREFRGWADLSAADAIAKMIEGWVIAQHTYWSVGRGLADARGRGKTLLRLRIVMDEGGWTLTPGTVQGNPPLPTPDRLRTALGLLHECGRL